MRTLLHALVLVLLTCLGSCTRDQQQETTSAEESSYIRSRASVIALENIRVIDGTGAAPREHQTILIVDGRIARVGNTGEIEIPERAFRMDLADRSVVPGLVMLHEHMMYFSGAAIWHSQPLSYPPLYLAAGVTTLRTAGSDYPTYDLNLKTRIDSGEAHGPRMHVTGPFFNGEDGGFLGDVIVRDEEDGRREVRYWASRGVTSFKTYESISSEAMKGVIEEAHLLGLTVAGHLGQVGCREAAGLGIDTIEHSFGSCDADLGLSDSDETLEFDPASPKVQELIRYLVDAGVTLTSTPMAVDRRISEEELALMHPETRKRYLNNMSGDRPPWWPDPADERGILKLDRAFVAAGGSLVLGADASDFGRIAGFANHQVLELMVEAGFEPLDVIRIATLEGARFLGVDEQLGSISEGKVADLIVIQGNPAVQMSDFKKIELVFKGGVAYDSVLLRESVRGIVGWH